MTDAAWLSAARTAFHQDLLASILTQDEHGVPANADTGSPISIEIARGIASRIGPLRVAKKVAGQTAGAKFEEACERFISGCLDKFLHLRPGKFIVERGRGIAQFDQFAHLAELASLAKSNPEIATVLGSDYLVKPDIVVGRQPESDAHINSEQRLVDRASAKSTPIRSENQQRPILHASLSCKWTTRSDRAQNARTEGLNLVRNRKGRLPHIGVILGEPSPSIIASLALGTGDIDCVYHFALYELRETVVAMGHDDRLALLDTMIDGQRLRDISDLPLDLTI